MISGNVGGPALGIKHRKAYFLHGLALLMRAIENAVSEPVACPGFENWRAHPILPRWGMVTTLSAPCRSTYSGSSAYPASTDARSHMRSSVSVVEAAASAFFFSRYRRFHSACFSGYRL